MNAFIPLRTSTVGVYVRHHPAHAWKFEHQCDPEFADIAKEVNKSFGVETLLMPPVDGKFQQWLCATQTQPTR
jgi:hypothetical protein